MGIRKSRIRIPRIGLRSWFCADYVLFCNFQRCRFVFLNDLLRFFVVCRTVVLSLACRMSSSCSTISIIPFAIAVSRLPSASGNSGLERATPRKTSGLDDRKLRIPNMKSAAAKHSPRPQLSVNLHFAKKSLFKTTVRLRQTAKWIVWDAELERTQSTKTMIVTCRDANESSKTAGKV
jgi:hypothetical protein